jgi:hypothetical protein
MARGEGLDASTMLDDPDQLLREAAAARKNAKASAQLTSLPPSGRNATLIRPVPHEPTNDKVCARESMANS